MNGEYKKRRSKGRKERQKKVLNSILSLTELVSVNKLEYELTTWKRNDGKNEWEKEKENKWINEKKDKYGQESN